MEKSIAAAKSTKANSRVRDSDIVVSAIDSRHFRPMGRQNPIDSKVNVGFLTKTRQHKRALFLRPFSVLISAIAILQQRPDSIVLHIKYDVAQIIAATVFSVANFSVLSVRACWQPQRGGSATAR